METKGEAPSSELFKVNVKTLDGKVHYVEVSSATTIAEFKSKIASATNVAPTVQRLIFQGKVLKDDQTVGSYSIRAGLTLHMVERPPEAPRQPAAGPPAAGAPTMPGTPIAGAPGLGQLRPGGIVMGTFALPNAAGGGAPPALDNLINSVMGSLGLPVQTTSIRVTATPSHGPPNENVVWTPVENVENQMQQLLNTILSTETQTTATSAEQFQPQGRAARRLVALGDLLDRTRPLWRRLAQAADDAPESATYQESRQLLAQSAPLFQQLTSYFLSLTPAVMSLAPPQQPPAGQASGAQQPRPPMPFPFMFPHAHGGQHNVQHFTFPMPGAVLHQHHQAHAQQQQQQQQQAPGTQSAPQQQQQQQPHPAAGTPFASLMSQLMPAVMPLAQQIAQQMNVAESEQQGQQPAQGGAQQGASAPAAAPLDLNAMLSQVLQGLSAPPQQQQQQQTPGQQQQQQSPQVQRQQQQPPSPVLPPLVPANAPPAAAQTAAPAASRPSPTPAAAAAPGLPPALSSMFGNILQSLSQPPPSAGSAASGAQGRAAPPPMDLNALFSSLLAPQPGASSATTTASGPTPVAGGSDRDRLMTMLTQAMVGSGGGTLAEFLNTMDQPGSPPSTEDDTVLGEILGIILGRLRPADVVSILQGDLAPTENLRGPIAAYLRHHAGIEPGADVSDEQLWGLKEEIVGAVSASMDDSSLPPEILAKLNPGAGLTSAAVEAFGTHTPQLLRLILAPADPSPVVPHPFATGLRDWARDLSVELVTRLAGAFRNGISDVPQFLRFFLLSRLNFVSGEMREAAADLITTYVMRIYSQAQASQEIREARATAQAGQQNATRRQREDELDYEDDEGDDENDEEGDDDDEDLMPSSWRQTLADDDLRQAMAPPAAPLSEAYLSGSLPKLAKRQKTGQ